MMPFRLGGIKHRKPAGISGVGPRLLVEGHDGHENPAAAFGELGFGDGRRHRVALLKKGHDFVQAYQEPLQKLVVFCTLLRTWRRRPLCPSGISAPVRRGDASGGARSRGIFGFWTGRQRLSFTDLDRKCAFEVARASAVAL